jgi:hypothetical protein
MNQSVLVAGGAVSVASLALLWSMQVLEAYVYVNQARDYLCRDYGLFCRLPPVAPEGALPEAPPRLDDEPQRELPVAEERGVPPMGGPEDTPTDLSAPERSVRLARTAPSTPTRPASSPTASRRLPASVIASGDLERFYPQRALGWEKESVVLLDCWVDHRGEADCDIRWESREGWQFGRAALRLARSPHLQFRPGYEGDRPLAGAPCILRISFEMAKERNPVRDSRVRCISDREALDLVGWSGRENPNERTRRRQG